MEAQSETEITNKTLSDSSYLKPKSRVLFRKHLRDMIAVIIDLENWRSEYLCQSPIADYRKLWYEKQQSEPELHRTIFIQKWERLVTLF